MTGWIEFTLAIVLFFAAHAIPVRPANKATLVRRIGQNGFTSVYSALSLGILAWLIIAAGRAPYVQIWGSAPWQKPMALALMAGSVLILSLGIARPNPLSFGGVGNHKFNPTSAGLIAWVRHPLLAGIGMWAAAHILPNGDVAHVILFGLFAGFSILGMRIIDRRKRQAMGPEWHRLVTMPRHLSLTKNGAMRLVIGAIVYAALIASHAALIGVSPLP